MGTPSYMAPEQAAGSASAVCPATDVFALGAVLYECLTGRPPFRAASVMETLHAVLHDEPASPRLLVPGVPRDLETVTLKCLAKEPARRYPDAAALAADLERFASGRPVLARPVGRAEAAWRWCRRNPRVAFLSAAVALSLTLGAAVSGWFALASQRDATVAREAEGRQRDARESASRALYLARLQLARVAWAEGDRATLGRHLDAAKPSDADPTDRRGFEWYYLDTQRRPEWDEIPLPGAQDVEFLDGRTVQYLRADRSVARFDLEARREVPLPAPIRLPDGVKSAGVARDGKAYATLDAAGDVEWWALEAGAWKRRYAGRPAEKPRDVQVTAGPLLVTEYEGGLITVGGDGAVGRVEMPAESAWMPGAQASRTFAQVGDSLPSPSGRGAPRFFSAPGGPLVLVRALGVSEGVVFDAAKGRTRFRLATARNGLTAAWSGDGTRLAVSLDGGLVAVADAKDGRVVRQFAAGDNVSLALSGDGAWLAAASAKGTHLFEVDSGRALDRLPGVAGPVALSPTGDRLYSWRESGAAVAVWSATAPGAEALTLSDARASPGGRSVFASEANRVSAREAATFRTLAEPPCPAWLVPSGDDGAASGVGVSRSEIWFWERGQKARRVASKLNLSLSPVYHAGTRRMCDLICPYDNSVARKGFDGGSPPAPYRLCVWDAPTGRELLARAFPQVWPYQACFSADGRWLVFAWKDAVMAYDLDGGPDVSPESPLANARPCFGTPGGVALLSAGRLLEWRCAENRLEPIASGLDGAVAVARLGDRLAASLRDRVSIRDIASGEELLSFPKAAESLRFSADGRFLIGLTGTGVSVWSAAGTGPEALADRRSRLERVAEAWHRAEAMRLSQQRPLPTLRIRLHLDWLKARAR